MSRTKQPLLFLITLAVILLAAGCNDQEGISEPGNGQRSDAQTEDAGLKALQPTDETVLVQLGRTYAHGFPEGFYQEYALNNLGEQAVSIDLIPVDSSNLALVIFKAADKTNAVLRLDEGTAGEAETTRFMPEAGLNYVLQVYEVGEQSAKYEISFTLE